MQLWKRDQRRGVSTEKGKLTTLGFYDYKKSKVFFRNEMDELQLLTRGCFEYYELCITLGYTWSSQTVDIEGFSHIHSDRSTQSRRKSVILMWNCYV